MAKSSSLNTKVSLSAGTLVLFALVFGLVGGYAIFKSLALSESKMLSYFGIAYQSAGSIRFSAGTNLKNPPAGLVVRAYCYDSTPTLVYDQTSPMDAWQSNPPGYVAFTQAYYPPTGLLCGATVYKTGSTKALGQVSYIAP